MGLAPKPTPDFAGLGLEVPSGVHLWQTKRWLGTCESLRLHQIQQLRQGILPGNSLARLVIGIGNNFDQM